MPNDVEQRLREIEERARKATPGPWYAKATDDASYMNAVYVSTRPGPFEHDNRRGMDPTAPGNDFSHVVAITLLQTPSLADIADAKWDENAEFIAYAREDVPWLLSLLREREEEVRALRHLLNEIECGTDDIREGLRGCGDHSCMVKKPLGMATNGGCRCVERNTFEVRVLIGRALRKAARLEEENRRLREALGWLVHLNHGVSRGGGQPTTAEWEDAWEHAEQLLRGEQP